MMASEDPFAKKVGFVGLGAMGFGMASHLLRCGYQICGYDVAPSQLAAFAKLGGLTASSPREAATDSRVLVVVVANYSQADTVFFHKENGAVQSLPKDGTIVLCATVPPSYYKSLSQRLVDVGRPDINVVDAPISGGATKANLGQLTILIAGSDAAQQAGCGVLQAMAEKLYHIPGQLGVASTMKMINQLLAGVNIAASAEAMTVAAKMGLNTRKVFDTVNTSSSWSWMFENRVEHMLRDDWIPKSALDIFVKDMGIVTTSARSRGFPCPLSAVTEQMYTLATSNGFGREDDAGLVRIYLPRDSSSLICKLAHTAVDADYFNSRVTVVLKLLEGIHLAAAIEAFAMAEKFGLDLKAVHEIISNAAGTSRSFENYHSLSSLSQLSERIKSLGLAIDEAKLLKAPVHLASTALQLLQLGVLTIASHEEASSHAELTNESKEEVSQTNGFHKDLVFEPRNYPSIPAKAALAELPEEYPVDTLPMIREKLKDRESRMLVVLDDDPTGTQTCHGINVVIDWSVDTLCKEMSSHNNGFFILTNSRALIAKDAIKLISAVCKNLEEASKKTDVKYELVLRGDSTLRGHFPLEVEVAAANTSKPDGWILAPFFFQGGRYTINDIHYVLESTDLIPVGNTQFAEDRTFGFRSSSLRDYVHEKAGAKKASSCVSISIPSIRTGGPEEVARLLSTVSSQQVVIVNAAAESDMHVFCAGLLLAQAQGKSFLFRTGAAFVSSRLGIEQIAPLNPSDITPDYAATTAGGLIVAGSYVPKTTKQLSSLRERRGDTLQTISIDVAKLFTRPEERAALCRRVARDASSTLSGGKDVLIMTSRELITGKDGASSLALGASVAEMLVEIVRSISVRPRYFIAKGGITSSDAATKTLGMKRAAIVGQGSVGCPLWRCDEAGAMWSGIPFLVFPGNVGSEDSLAEVVERWALPTVS